MLKYSIIIPTCNNDLTKKCLDCIKNLNSPKEEYEVLVIENGTKKEIEDTVKDFESCIYNLKYFYEPNAGLHYGRHRGAKEAQGEILCYLDDDSFVDENWLIAIEETFKNPSVLLAGGNNIPLFEEKPPKWLKYFWIEELFGKWLGHLSLIEFSEKQMKLPAWYVFGCNFIIKKSALFDFGGFNPDCVPKNLQRYQGDGETALSLKLNQAGGVAYFNPNIKIHHLVPKSRMTLEYFQKRAFYQGVCDSFSQIREKNGMEYYNYTPNDNVEVRKLPFLKRKYNKIIKPLCDKYLQKYDKDYKMHLSLKAEYEKSYKEGFEFHQNEVKNDPELLKWVLKENYLD